MAFALAAQAFLLIAAFVILAVRLEIGLPDGESTMLAELARTAVGDGAANLTRLD